MESGSREKTVLQEDWGVGWSTVFIVAEGKKNQSGTDKLFYNWIQFLAKENLITEREKEKKGGKKEEREEGRDEKGK